MPVGKSLEAFPWTVPHKIGKVVPDVAGELNAMVLCEPVIVENELKLQCRAIEREYNGD